MPQTRHLQRSQTQKNAQTRALAIALGSGPCLCTHGSCLKPVVMSLWVMFRTHVFSARSMELMEGDGAHRQQHVVVEEFSCAGFAAGL